MKVVLLQDVPGLGRKNEVKSVSDGYAQNALIPKKLAVAGTPSSVLRAERAQVAEAMEHQIQGDLLLKNIASLEGVSIEISGRANEKGHLFASIHPEAIAAELKKQKGIDVLPTFLEAGKPIKAVGEHEISVRVQNKTARFSLVVKPDSL